MENDWQALPYHGLSADEVAQRVAMNQTNKQPPKAGKNTLQILAGNLFTLFNLLNLILAIALIAVGSYRNLLFMGVVISNTLISTIQELRAKRTIDRLQLLSAPKVEAIRDGQAATLAMEDIVLDDLIVLRPGEQLCADAEVISGSGAMNESLLTGESEPVDKQPGSPLLSGSYMTEGLIYARVTKVGADSYAAQLTQKARSIQKPNSELMRSMRYIIRTVGALILPLGIILLCKQYFLLDMGIQEAVTATVAAMLGMIPEGLMLLTSVALAVGVVRLGKRNTLVQELYGIESLARVDTLCIDKTGTITRGTMAVSGIEALAATQDTLNTQMGALVSVMTETNATFSALRENYTASPGWKPTHTVPFSSARKWCAATFEGQGSLVLGAAEFVLPGALTPALAEAIQAHAAQGKRVLLLCHSPEAIQDKTLPKGLIPQGLILLSDVLRDDAADTFEFFAREGVQVKVISGDHPLTVMNVAQQAGLPNADKAIDATTLDTPEKLTSAAETYTVFGRVTPEQKKDLVYALKRQSHTVAMMGDGVNDIPALKASDCAIAMAGGSDAAKRVSQLTLLDAKFSAVPHIVMEGRRVINNITRASSLFLVKTTFSFLLSLLLVFLPMSYPFAPIQMTLISSMTVGIPSFFLALEPNRARVSGNFLFNVLRNALPGGLTVVIQILILYLLSGPLNIGAEALSTIATWTTGCTGLLVLLFTCLPFNRVRGALWIAMATGFVLAALLLGDVFYLTDLSATLRWCTAGVAALAVPLMLALRSAMRHVKTREIKVK